MRDYDFFADDPNDENKPYLFLDFLSDRTSWRPSGVVKDLPAMQTTFEGLLKGGTAISASDLMGVVPSGLENLYDARGRTQNGFKFEWNDKAGNRWHVHGHSPDLESPAGSDSSRSWIVRISYTSSAGGAERYMRNSFEASTKQIPGGRHWVPARTANKHPTHIVLNR